MQNDEGDHIILFTTDPDLSRTSLTDAAKSKQAGVLGLPKPRDIHHITEIPKLPTGKTDYPALSSLLKSDLETVPASIPDARGAFDDSKGAAKPEAGREPESDHDHERSPGRGRKPQP